MNYKYMMSYPFLGKRITTITAVVIIAGIAMSTLFITKKRQRIKSKLTNLFSRKSYPTAQTKLGNLIEDVRNHVKQNAEGLLGPKNQRHNPTEISVAVI